MATNTGAPRRADKAYSWLLAILLPAFAVYVALRSPIEEHSYDAAAFHLPRGAVFAAARAAGDPYPRAGDLYPRAGDVYPRWVQPLNAGLGGPLFSFYSPLAYYGLDALQALGLPLPAAWRLLVALALILASTGAFALARELSGDAAGALAAAAIYVYSFPLLRDLFERGSPQGFALALVPWVLYTLLRLARRPSGANLALAAAAWAAVILTHNLSAAFLLPVWGLAALLFASRRDWRAVGAAGLAFGCGLLLSSFFLLPSLAERGYVQLDNAVALDYARVAENAVPLEELLGLPPAYDTGLNNNLFGEAAGPLQALVALAGLLAGVALWIRRRERKALPLLAFSLLSLGVLWLQTTSADPLWRALPALAYVQARSRLLGLTVLSSAVLVALLVPLWGGRWRAALPPALIAACLLLALPVLYPDLQYRYADFEPGITADEVTASSLAAGTPGLTAFNEFLPVWRYLPLTQEEAQRVRQSLFAGLPEGSRIVSQERGMSWARAAFELPATADVSLHILYFPGWAGYLDGEARRLSPAEGSGYIVLANVPAGAHSLELRYEGTALQHIATWVSAIATAGLLLAALVWRGRPAPPAPPREARYPAPRWWLPLGFLLLVALKALVIDGHTGLFRRQSTCSSVHGADSSLQAQFAGGLHLCAVDLPRRSYKPGDTINITLYWQATEAIEEPTDSFVHLLGATFNPRTGNPLWGQQDKQLPGYHPLTQWRPDEIYRDRYTFRIDPNAPPGEYQLEIGWVQPATGQRLAPQILQGAPDLSVSHLDSLLLGGIELRQP